MGTTCQLSLHDNNMVGLGLVTLAWDFTKSLPAFSGRCPGIPLRGFWPVMLVP